MGVHVPPPPPHVAQVVMSGNQEPRVVEFTQEAMDAGVEVCARAALWRVCLHVWN